MTTEPRQEAERLVNRAVVQTTTDERRTLLNAVLAAAIEVDRKNHPNFVNGDAIFMSRLDALREALSALREDET